MSPRIRVRIWLAGVVTALTLIALQGISLRVSAQAETDAEAMLQADLSAIERADAQLAAASAEVESGRPATGALTALDVPAGLQRVAVNAPQARPWIQRVGYVLTEIPGAEPSAVVATLTDARQHLRRATAYLEADRARHAGSRAGLWGQLSRLAILAYALVFAGGLGAYVIVQLPAQSASAKEELAAFMSSAERAVQAALALQPSFGAHSRVEVLAATEQEQQTLEDAVSEEAADAVAEDAVAEDAVAEDAVAEDAAEENVVAEGVVDEAANADEAELVTEDEGTASPGVHIEPDILTTLRHELRTPLSVILGYATELENELTGDQQTFVQAIRSGGERLFDTLESLLQYAEIEGKGLTLVPERLDVHATVEEVLKQNRPAAFDKRLNLMYRATPESTWVDIDPNALKTAVGHLVRNAVKFTKEGLIVISVDAEPDSVRITVADTGPGMVAEDIERVLKPFSQRSTGDDRQFEGLGLGLTISAHLVRANGGQMEVESTPGAGSKFSILLPRKTAPESTLRRAA